MRIRSIAVLMIVLTPALFAQRGAPAPADPMPRLANGTPNLGRVAGEKGIWGVPWIRNMALRIDNDQDRLTYSNDPNTNPEKQLRREAVHIAAVLKHHGD